jgi:hypothetical protein
MTLRKVQYIFGRLLGEAELPFDTPFPDSWAFFCPECGEIWMRVWTVMEHSPWHILEQACEKHTPQAYAKNPVAGSILTDLNHTQAFRALQLDNLPPAVLKREFNLHMKDYHDRQDSITSNGLSNSSSRPTNARPEGSP